MADTDKKGGVLRGFPKPAWQAVFSGVWSKEKKQGTYFKIGQTYFKIQGTNFSGCLSGVFLKRTKNAAFRCCVLIAHSGSGLRHMFPARPGAESRVKAERLYLVVNFWGKQRGYVFAFLDTLPYFGGGYVEQGHVDVFRVSGQRTCVDVVAGAGIYGHGVVVENVACAIPARKELPVVGADKELECFFRKAVFQRFERVPRIRGAGQGELEVGSVYAFLFLAG